MITAGQEWAARLGLLPEAWLAYACPGPRGPTFLCCLLQEGCTKYQASGLWAWGPPHMGPSSWHTPSCQFIKLMGKPTGTMILGTDLGESEGRGERREGGKSSGTQLAWL